MIIDQDNPVYRLETRRQFSSKRLLTLQRGCMPILFMVLTVSMTLIAVPMLLSKPWQADTYITQLITTMFGLMVFFQILAGAGIAVLTIAQAAPTISGEREVQSWNLLRTTTLPLGAIISGKFVGVMARLRAPLSGVLVLRVLSGITGLLVVVRAVVREGIYYMSAGELADLVESGLWIPATVFVILASLFYLTQPLVQFSINASLGMFYSVLTSSRGRALAAGYGARVFLWMVMGLTYYGLGSLFSMITNNYYSYSTPHYLSSLTYRQEGWLLVGMAILAIVVVLAWQFGLILFMMGFVHRRAYRMGAIA